jgi:hypothetical protein
VRPTAAALAILLLALPSFAQPRADESPAARSRAEAKLGPHETWTLRAEPSIWYVAPGGHFKLPGLPSGGEELFMSDVNLDSPRVSPFVELHLRAEDWLLSFSGFAFSADSRASTADFSGFVGEHPFSPGDRLESSLDFVSAQFQAGYRIPWRLGRKGEDFQGLVDVLGGVQFIDVDLDVAAPSGAVSVNEFWAMPILGGKLSMDITRRFTIDVQMTFGYFNDGGGRSSFTWDICPGFMYYPFENVGVQVGYRQLLFDLRSGDEGERFFWHGAMAGIYGGLAVRF